jgi:hypothetical protein
MPLDQPLLVTSYALLKQKDYFFILLQSELGDLYRVTLTYADEEVRYIYILCINLYRVTLTYADEEARLACRPARPPGFLRTVAARQGRREGVGRSAQMTRRWAADQAGVTGGGAGRPAGPAVPGSAGTGVRRRPRNGGEREHAGGTRVRP